MDVEQKLGQSLDDLIKNQRKETKSTSGKVRVTVTGRIRDRGVP
jgi:hypothetical protein